MVLFLPIPEPTKKLRKIWRDFRSELSRKQKGSNNRNKARLKLAKAYQRVANIRKDTIHKFTSWLCKNHAVIGLEDLNVSGMLKNNKLAGAIADSALYEIRRQVEYKSSWYGSVVVLADRFYPSTKTCSNCGHVQEIALKERVFNCQACGVSIDRDLNASLNLERFAEGYSV
ncbi:RNA-guided endonuclease TnpB family protein [Limnoraphis robusta Tam1]|uniref:RNA-guided endonuclease InsQ/TnpB family protein n=1 Tax=Limnoraphis robusta TaxID=1118279 RepID=UPI002B1EA209|nr:RNA-guided endonuclease TnpB family protein [Limnoraphis robusta]MEA5500421.1 RNA-guided endonuclease TnpB family protein [Limnoraphis robusta BA-68 BA1]MEA5537865.1 RNA-guided endonuclease TnpB family protein [Limnoraphis robusta Tam1]